MVPHNRAEKSHERCQGGSERCNADTQADLQQSQFWTSPSPIPVQTGDPQHPALTPVKVALGLALLCYTCRPGALTNPDSATKAKVAS